jgi:outer membrane lipoprotein SlyB
MARVASGRPGSAEGRARPTSANDRASLARDEAGRHHAVAERSDPMRGRHCPALRRIATLDIAPAAEWPSHEEKRAMKRTLAVCTASLWLLAGCATTQPWTPVVDTYGNSRAQFVHRDTEECRQMARQVSGHSPNQAARGAVTGGLIGAAGGAALGAALGNAGRGAAIGAAAGGIGQGVRSGAGAERNFQQAFNNCMRGRGHNVLN